MTGAIDIGGTKIAVGVVDAGGRVVSRLESPTDPQRGFGNAVARMVRMLRECAATAGAEIEGIGIGCTGPVDAATGMILNAETIPGWEGNNLVEAISREFNVRVAMENDADAAALGELAWGAGRGTRCFIYVTLSTGIGVGVIADGRLYRGVEGFHPEIGHQVIDASGPPCYCGATGCWESLASGPAVVEWMKANAGQKNRYAGELTAQQIFELAEQGDPLAARAVEREGRYVGIGLANLVTMYCPEAIALGGGVMKSSHMFLDRAREVIRTTCGLVPHEKTAIVEAELGGDTGLAGAARVWHHRFITE